MNGENLEEMEQMKQIEEMKRKILSSILSKEAFERLGRVRAINKELSSQVELYLMQIFQTGKIRDRISDEKMKEILRVLSHKRGFSIKRK